MRIKMLQQIFSYGRFFEKDEHYDLPKEISEDLILNGHASNTFVYFLVCPKCLSLNEKLTIDETKETGLKVGLDNYMDSEIHCLHKIEKSKIKGRFDSCKCLVDLKNNNPREFLITFNLETKKLEMSLFPMTESIRNKLCINIENYMNPKPENPKLKAYYPKQKKREW